jgi:hypothetical protein
MSIKENYSTGSYGKIVLHVNKNNSNTISEFTIHTLGQLSSSIKAYASNNSSSFDIYIAGNWSWPTLNVDRVTFGDLAATATGKNITLTKVTALPSSYSTASIITGIHSGNYNSYAPKLDGTGASGTWDINISGTAASANWLNVNNTLTYGASGLNYFNINGTAGNTKANNTPTSDWYHIIRMNHANSGGYLADLAVPLNDVGGVWWRQIRNGSFYGWYKLLDNNNYTDYTVTKTGSGASGTWGINISGGAATATSATSANYSRNLLGRNTSGGDYDAVDGNLIFAEWNTYSDNRWYLKAKGYETRVGYANSSGNASYAVTAPAAANWGGTDTTTKIKIKINSTKFWMLSFVVTIYQGYKSSKVMVSGYNYGTSYWHQPEAVLLGDSNGATSISVYFGYDSA